MWNEDVPNKIQEFKENNVEQQEAKGVINTVQNVQVPKGDIVWHFNDSNRPRDEQLVRYVTDS